MKRPYSTIAWWEHLCIVPYLFLLLIVLFWRPIFKGESLTIAAQLYLDPLYKDAAPQGFKGVYAYDIDISPAYQRYPYDLYIAERLSLGDFPVWNPYMGAGTPFFANVQSSPFSYLKFLLYLAPTGRIMQVYDYFLLLHLFCSGYFMFVCARMSGIRFEGAGFAASAGILNGWTLVEFGFVHYSTASLFPVLLLSLEALSVRPGPRSSMLAALAVAVTIFAGHPMEAFVLIAGGAGYYIVRALVSHRRQLVTSLLWFTVSFFLAALCSSIILLPFTEFLGHGISYKLISVPYLPPKPSVPLNLVGTVLPTMTPVLGDEYYLGFIGIGVCLFAMYGLVSNGVVRNLPFVALILFSFGMAFQVYPLSLMRALPLLDLVDPRYAFPLFFFPAAFLAGQGLDRLMGTDKRAVSVKMAATFLSVAELVIRLHGLVLSHPSFAFPETSPLSFIKKDGDVFRVLVLGTKDIVDTPSSGMVHSIQDLRMTENIVVRRYWNFIHLADRGIRSLHARGEFFPTAMYATAAVSPYWDLMNVKYVLSPKPVRKPSLEGVYRDPYVCIYKNTNAFPRAFAVHRVIFSGHEMESLKLLQEHRDELGRLCIIEENNRDQRQRIREALGSKMPKIQQPVEMTEYFPHEVTMNVAMSDPGFLILSDVYYPGWKVFVDGREEKIYPADYLLRGVFLEKGEHRVKFSYTPFSFKSGTMISAASIVLCVIFPLIHPPRKRPRRLPTFERNRSP